MATIAGIQLYNPLPIIAQITSRLGDSRGYGPHEGYDLKAPAGTNILAAGAGRVTQAGFQDKGYGYFVEIEHAPGLRTLYGHMREKPVVEEDEQVSSGQLLGHVGSTGYSTGPHLHFHIKYNSVYQDVANFVDLGVKGAASKAGQIVSKLLPCDDSFDVESIEDESSYQSAFDAWLLCITQKFAEDPEQLEGITKDPETAFSEAVERRRGSDTSQEGETGECKYSLDLGLLGTPCFDSMIVPLQDFAYNILFAGPRALINAFKLSDAPLADGRATYEWLKLPDNNTLFLASLVALLLIIVLLLIAASHFLSNPSVKVANVIDNPASSVVEAVS
jgi:hypothetical protein